jgi:hypothetical protein
MFTLSMMVNELNMTLRKLILFSALTVLIGVSVVYALSYEFKPSPSLPSTGTLSISAYYAVKQPDGSYEGSYVQVPVTVTGPQSHNGTTVIDENNPLNFTVAPGQYSVSGTYENATPLTVTANVSAGSYVKVLLNFGSSPPPPSLPPTTEGVNDDLELTMTLEKTEYSLGEPINITLTITNISNQTKNFGMGPDANDFDFHVYNDTDSNIYSYSNRWEGVAIPQYVILETLNAGESLSENLAWPQTCHNTGLSEGVPVSPGTYYIVGRIGPPFFYGENNTIETAPIQVTIVAS